MRRSIAVFAALALAGCSTQLQSDLGTAEAPCHEAKFADKTELAQCLDKVEEPVWAKDDPKTLDLYDEFAQGRAELSKERDAGTLTDTQYDDRLEALAKDLRAQIADRRKTATD
jgi:hypothetical protein